MMGLQFDNDFVIIGQQPWDTEIGSNCKDIALELSKTNRVLYVNSPLDRITLYRNITDAKVKKRLDVIKGRLSGLVQVNPNLWTYYPDCIVESINWLNSSLIFDFINKRNNLKFSASVRKALTKLGFNNIILFNDNEIFKGFYLKENLKPALSIYYSRDFMIGVDYWKKHGVRLEAELIGKSDLCFANSEYLADYCKQFNKNSYNVGQGCDVDDFVAAAGQTIEELNSLNRKRIGYVGSLNSERLNIQVIIAIAKHYTDCYIILVGPEDDKFSQSELHQLENVIFTGQKPVSNLPLYINSFDVCINPQVVNQITIGNYPRKIDEYLASGKAVVATKTKTMEFFKDYVYLADKPEDYILLINTAMENDSESLKNARISFALQHTWQESVQSMAKEIHKQLKFPN
jgi:teichuronic acid biosynthesis glycosyltransferase TuaH